MTKRKLGIVVDSTIGGDFGKKIFHDISIVPLTIILDEKSYYEKDLENKVVFDLLNQNKSLTTSQPNPQLFLKAFKEQLALGYEHIVCVTISKKLSGTFNSAQKAKQILNNPQVNVIDSGSVGPGMLFTLQKIKQYIETSNPEDYSIMLNDIIKKQSEGKLLFTLNDIKQLIINKRISKIKYFIGQLFKIKPIIKFQEGIISVEKNLRNWKNIFQYLIKKIVQEQKTLENIEIKIVYVNKDNLAQEFKNEIEKLKNPKIKISMYGSISPIIAVHLSSDGFGFYLNKI
ncbi:MAG: DegV family protein [Vigna little leaf phytoplasma]|nr:DegV family protein [Vigna little leaf phytoplasma]